MENLLFARAVILFDIGKLFGHHFVTIYRVERALSVYNTTIKMMHASHFNLETFDKMYVCSSFHSIECHSLNGNDFIHFLPNI